MGAMGSKKKKQGAANGNVMKPMPPKPLTAVSEGEEHAWSSIHVEDDKDDAPEKPRKVMGSVNPSASPKASPISSESKHASSAISTSTNEAAVRIESATSTEEKEDMPPSQDQHTDNEEPESFSPSEAEPIVNEEVNTRNEPSIVEIPMNEEPANVVEEVNEPPPREPTPDPLQEGGYLIFSTVNDGSMFLQFSHSKVEEAIAYFKPNRVVPAFKYRQNHGKVELIRKLQSNKQLYYEGYADFLKAAKEFDSDLYVIQNTARVYRQLDGSKVTEVPLGTFVDLRVNNVAVIPPNNTSFDGVKNIHPDQFISTGNKHGKAIKF